MTTEIKSWSDSKSTNFCYQPYIHNHLCHTFPLSSLPGIFNPFSPHSHSVSSQTPQPCTLWSCTQLSGYDTLSAVVVEDAICLRASGRFHLLKHRTGNSIRVWGSGAKESLKLGRIWKELSGKLRNLAQYKACLGTVLGTGDTEMNMNLFF